MLLGTIIAIIDSALKVSRCNCIYTQGHSKFSTVARGKLLSAGLDHSIGISRSGSTAFISRSRLATIKSNCIPLMPQIIIQPRYGWSHRGRKVVLPPSNFRLDWHFRTHESPTASYPVTFQSPSGRYHQNFAMVLDTTVAYLARESVFDTVKAFDTDFPVAHIPGAQRTNLRVDVKNVQVHEITDSTRWDLDTHGFCVIHAKTHLDPRAVWTQKKKMQNEYWDQIERVLEKRFPEYSRIESYDLTVRVLSKVPSDLGTYCRVLHIASEQRCRLS